MSKLAIACTLGVLLLLSPPGAWAQRAPAHPNRYLQEAKDLYKNLRYAEIVHKLERALAVPGNTPVQLCEIYELMGTVHVILGNQDAAVDAFNELLNVDPKYKLDSSLSPKILSIYRRVKSEFVPRESMGFEGRPSVRTTKGKKPWLEVGVVDESKAVTGLEVWFRRSEKEQFKKGEMAPVSPGRYGGFLPLETERIPSSGVRVEYVIVARGEKGKTLGVLGSMENPLSFTVLPTVAAPPTQGPGAKGDSTPWYGAWWFWTAVGVVAAGAGVGIYLGVTASGTEVPIGSLGQHTLE
jgi:hypothetical protein